MQKKLIREVVNFKNYILVSKFLAACGLFFLCASFGYREPAYCKMVSRITKDYLKESAIPRRLLLTGYGGAMMKDVEEVFLTFLSFDALNVDKARILYVEMMEEYLKKINHHDKIRPYLHNFPFIIDNIKLDIGFEDCKRKITQDGHVAFIFMGRNHTIYYDAYDPETEEFYSLHRESYEEALKIVKEHSKLDPLTETKEFQSKP